MRKQVLATILLASAASGAVYAQSASRTTTSTATTPAAPGKPKLGDFGVDLTAMDRKVAPGDDFYNYVNGAWMARTEIPADKASWGGFGILRDLSDQRTRAVIEGAAASPSSDPVAAKIGDTYAGFMDAAAIEAAGAAPLKPYLAKIATIRSQADLAKAFGEGVGDPFGEPASVDEHEGGPIFADVAGDAVVDFGPHFAGGDCTELVFGELDREVHFATMAYVYDGGLLVFIRREVSGNGFDGAYGGGESDALGRVVGQCAEARQGQRKMGATLVVRHGVDFVDDDCARGPQHFAGLFGGDEDEERFRSRDEDVRRLTQHLLALMHRGVACTDGGADRSEMYALRFGERSDFREWGLEVALDVVRKGLERRNVDDGGFVGQGPRAGLANELIDADQESGEGFAGSGGSGDENIAAGGDVGPALELGFRGMAETRGEPFGYERIKIDGKHERLRPRRCFYYRRWGGNRLFQRPA